MSANRRDFLKTAALTGVAGLGGLSFADRAFAAMGKGSDVVAVGENGSYETVALTKDSV